MNTFISTCMYIRIRTYVCSAHTYVCMYCTYIHVIISFHTKFLIPVNTDIDECAMYDYCDRLGDYGYCINTVGSYECLCEPGYFLSSYSNFCLRELPTEHITCTHSRYVRNQGFIQDFLLGGGNFFGTAKLT